MPYPAPIWEWPTVPFFGLSVGVFCVGWCGVPVGRSVVVVVCLAIGPDCSRTQVQSYSWDSVQHINVLELAAVLNFLRFAARDLEWANLRVFHIVDSRVVSCVLAKGRSSSKLLNRLLRRICSVLVACDLYILPLWTISQWNFGDIPSRVVGRPPD